MILLRVKRTEDDELEALHAGADAFMTKSFATCSLGSTLWCGEARLVSSFFSNPAL